MNKNDNVIVQVRLDCSGFFHLFIPFNVLLITYDVNVFQFKCKLVIV